MMKKRFKYTHLGSLTTGECDEKQKQQLSQTYGNNISFEEIPTPTVSETVANPPAKATVTETKKGKED